MTPTPTTPPTPPAVVRDAEAAFAEWWGDYPARYVGVDERASVLNHQMKTAALAAWMAATRALVAEVERLTRERNETYDVLQAYKEASAIVQAVGYVDALNRSLHTEAERNAQLRAHVADLKAALRLLRSRCGYATGVRVPPEVDAALADTPTSPATAAENAREGTGT